MFDPLAPVVVVTAMGRAANAAARSTEASDDFSQGQLMSVFSASRHLGVELAQFEPEVRAFADRIAAALRDAGLAPARAAELDEVRDAQRAGDVTAALLDDLRGDTSAQADALRATLHHELRLLCDREVALLADVIEAKR